MHHASPDADLERLTVIEWARDRLQQAINKRYVLSHCSGTLAELFPKNTINVSYVLSLYLKRGGLNYVEKFVIGTFTLAKV